MKHQHDQIIERWFHDLFARGDLAVLDDLALPGFRSYTADGRLGSRDREAFREWLRWYLSSFTGAEWTIHDIVKEGDRAAVRYSGRTTYRGGLMNIPSKDQRVTEMGMLLFRFQNGRIAEMWSALCDLELVQELGGLPDWRPPGTS